MDEFKALQDRLISTFARRYAADPAEAESQMRNWRANMEAHSAETQRYVLAMSAHDIADYANVKLR